MLQHAEVLRKLEEEIDLNGSLRRAASSLRISPQYLSAVLAGDRAIGPKLLRSLKLRRIVRKTVTYEARR
jgi:hypothetical protein